MKKRKLFWIYILALLTLLCIGCGEKDEQREYGIDGYIYKGEWISLMGGDVADRLDHMKVYGDYLYYSYNETLFRMYLANGVGMEEAEKYVSDYNTTTQASFESMVDYEVCGDGEIYLAMEVWRRTGEWGEKSEKAGCAVVKRLADGTELYHVYLPETYLNSDPCMAVSDEGEVYLLTDQGIYCVDQQGNASESVPTAAYKGNGMEDFLLGGAGGRIYYCVGLMGNGCSLYELVRGNEPRLESLGGTPERERCYGFFPSEHGILCDTNNGLFQYKEETGWREVLRWGETEIFHSNGGLYELAQIDEGTFIGKGPRSAGGLYKELCLLKQETVKDRPEREEVVLASVFPGDPLMQAVTEFNQASDKYRVVVESYEYGEIETGLNPRLVSSNPPDLLDVAKLDIMNYAEKGTFEDLAPYLEKSSVLDRDMFLENVLEGYTIDGRLVSIPGSFYIDAVVGRASQLGDRMGWTMEDVMDLAGKYPDQRITLYESAEFLIKELCSRYICEGYIDWEKGECRFDGEGFCRFLEWVKENSESFRSNYSYGVWDKKLETERMIDRDDMCDLRCYAQKEILFGEDVTFVGYPTEDGRAVFQAFSMNALSMVASSKHKEGAWAFIEYMLSREDQNIYDEFPSRKDLLERVIEEEMTPEYYETEDGEILMHQGKPVEKSKDGYGVAAINSMTQEEADILWKVIDAIDFRPIGGVRDKVTDIILEEMESYMDGTRTVEDTARIIQNRVRTLVQENGVS